MGRCSHILSTRRADATMLRDRTRGIGPTGVARRTQGRHSKLVVSPLSFPPLSPLVAKSPEVCPAANGDAMPRLTVYWAIPQDVDVEQPSDICWPAFVG